MISMLAQIGFDPQIRGALVVTVGVIMLFGTVFGILATNQGIRLAALISLAAFFGWMVIMGGFWWIRGIGFVGDSVSWQVLDFNREDISQSSVEAARVLPDGIELQGLGIEVARDGLANGVEEMDEFLIEPDPEAETFAEMTAAQLEEEFLLQAQRNESTTLSQIMGVAPDFVEDAEGTELSSGREFPSLNGWTVMTAGEAGEAQAAAGAAILESDAFDFDAQTEFKFLDAFTIGGKPEIGRDNDLGCTLCIDNLERGWLWVTNSARIKNPTEYAVVQLRALDEQALIVEEGQAPRFPAVDEDAQIVSVVLVRELGNLRFPPAMVTLGSLLIFTALVYMLHLRDLATMRRVDEHEARSPNAVLPLVGIMVLGILFAAVSFFASRLLAPNRPNDKKNSAYECGIEPAKETPERFPVRFFLIAMIFIVFDIELIFFYPFAVAHESLGAFGLFAILIFTFSVFESFVYLIGNGALEWGPVHTARRLRAGVSEERTTRSTIRRVGQEGRLESATTIIDDIPSDDPEPAEAA